MTNDRLEQLGAAKTVDMEFLRHVVVKASGRQITSVTQLFRGESNVVFDVALADGTSVIARQHILDAHESTRFHHEARTMQAAKDAQVPVAVVLGIEEAMTGLGRVAVSVQTKLPGRPLLESLPLVTPSEAERVMADIRVALQRLHRMPTDGLGLLPAQSLAEIVESVSVVRQAIKAGRLPNTVAPVLDTAVGELGDARFEQTGLVHMDFFPEHVFIEGQRVTGIIDWELAALGDAAFDYANWRFWRPDIDSTNQPRYPEILGDLAPTIYGRNFPERIRWAELRLGVRKLVLYTQDGQLDNYPGGMTDAIRTATFLKLAIDRPLIELTNAHNSLDI